MTTSQGCGGHHPGISEELRSLVLAAVERIDPVLERMRDEAAGRAAGTSAETCSACPVCAVLATLRGERPELAVRLTEHAAGLIAVLRDALDDDGPAAQPDPAPEPSSARRVQRIRVDRPAR